MNTETGRIYHGTAEIEAALARDERLVEIASSIAFCDGMPLHSVKPLAVAGDPAEELACFNSLVAPAESPEPPAWKLAQEFAARMRGR